MEFTLGEAWFCHASKSNTSAKKPSQSSGGSPEEAILFASCDKENWWMRLRWPRSVDKHVPSLQDKS
jgi:hypothetical protein